MFDIAEARPRYDLFQPSKERPAVTVCVTPEGYGDIPLDPKLKALEPLWTGLSLPPAPPLAEFRAELTSICPNMAGLIDWMAGELALRHSLSENVAKLPPILLHGPPGVGKTHLAHAIADALRVPSWLFSLAGNSDSGTISGTSRRYSTGSPSLPVQIMAQTRCAAAAILIDEIDKVAEGSSNGRSTDGLLPFLEPASARGVLDEFLMTQVDVSRVNWIATANDIARVPRPLLTRFACFEMAHPPEHDDQRLLELAGRSLAEEFGLDAGASRILFDPHLRAAARLPAGASVRAAKSLLRAALGRQMLAATRH